MLSPTPVRRLSRIGIVVALAGAAAAPHAQTVQGGNPLDQLPSPAPVPSVRAPAPQVDARPPAGAADGAGKLERRIVPSRFDIEGVKALPFPEIAALFAPLAGQPVAVARLVELAAQATALYKQAGMPLSFVYLPDQEFDGGVVRVVAVEGYIGSVRIDGDAGPAEARLRAIAGRLLAERPLRQATFDRVTQLLLRLPGLTVGAAASMPATTDGATELVLKVARQPYNVSLGADLRQPTPRAVLSGSINDPFVPGGQLSASTLLGDVSREKLLTVGYTQLVGTDGLQLKAQATAYRGYPDKKLDSGSALERFNTNRRVEFSASYPLLLDARSSLTLNGGVYGVDNADDYRVPATGARLTDDTRVRAAFAQLSFLDVQSDRSRGASILLAQGIDGAGASSAIRSNIAGLGGAGTARLDFTRLSIEGNQRDRFAGQWGTAVSFGAQYSPHSLAASERVSFGGPRFGRGYAAGDAAGDSGWGVGLELNRIFRLESVWLKQIEPYLLVEQARVSTDLGRPMPQKLRSLALGVRLSDAKHYSLDLAIAKPTGDAAIDNPARKMRVSLMLSYQLAAR